jgi:hypothetical protein
LGYNIAHPTNNSAYRRDTAGVSEELPPVHIDLKKVTEQLTA